MDEKEDKTETYLIAIVVDATPSRKLAGNESSHTETVPLLYRIFDAVIVFGNAHLLQSSHNKLAVLACNSLTTKFLYPPESGNLVQSHNSRAGQYDLFNTIETQVRNGLGNLMLDDCTDHTSTKSDSLVGGAMARALCHIHRVKQELPLNSQLKSKIVVVSGSSDSALQYMTFMNVFFSAQKENVVVDCCMMDADSGLLQQGCDITGGRYLRIPNMEGLLAYLNWVFLPSSDCRNKIVLPPPTKVDYRAACFCHRKLVDIAYVCSVCLSIFCSFCPICTTCNTVFKKTKINGQAMPAKGNKKKRPRLE